MMALEERAHLRATWLSDTGEAAKVVIRLLDELDELDRKFAREAPTQPRRPSSGSMGAVKP
jgi:hypothetical protein